MVKQVAGGGQGGRPAPLSPFARIAVRTPFLAPMDLRITPMSNHASFHVPSPVNEPNLSYAPGTSERRELRARLDEISSAVIDVPCVIGGEEVRGSSPYQAVMPHNHAHVLANVHRGGSAEVEKAIAAAAEAWPAFRDARLAQGITALAISAEKGSGLAELRERLSKLLPSAAELAEPPEPAGIVVHRLESSGNTFTVAREDGILVVHGRKIERLASQTNFEVEESAERFQQDLVRLGVDHELRRQGVAPGETVRIGGSELERESDVWEDR